MDKQGPNVEEFLVGLTELDDIDTKDKLMLWVTICDEKKIMEALTHQANMLRVGMAVENVIHPFVYGIMRIVKPHLFKESDDE